MKTKQQQNPFRIELRERITQMEKKEHEEVEQVHKVERRQK